MSLLSMIFKRSGGIPFDVIPLRIKRRFKCSGGGNSFRPQQLADP